MGGLGPHAEVLGVGAAPVAPPPSLSLPLFFRLFLADSTDSTCLSYRTHFDTGWSLLMIAAVSRVRL